MYIITYIIKVTNKKQLHINKKNIKCTYTKETHQINYVRYSRRNFGQINPPETNLR